MILSAQQLAALQNTDLNDLDLTAISDGDGGLLGGHKEERSHPLL